MRTNAIVIVPPSFSHGPCFIERQEPVLVQTLVAKPTIERLNERIIRWLSWPAEVELHAARVRPQIQAPRAGSINRENVRRRWYEERSGGLGSDCIVECSEALARIQ